MVTRGVSRSNRCIKVFVVLQSGSLCTIRGLSGSFSLADLKAKLEIVAGIPAAIYSIHFPEGTPLYDEDVFVAGRNVKNGAILKIKLSTQWDEVYRAVLMDSWEELSSALFRDTDSERCELREVVESPDTTTDRERCFIALYLACFLGRIKLCQRLLALGTDMVGQTSFGRTSLHAATVGNNPGVVELLLHYGANHSHADDFSLSALKYARELHLWKCESILREASIRTRAQSSRSFRFFATPSDCFSLVDNVTKSEDNDMLSLNNLKPAGDKETQTDDDIEAVVKSYIDEHKPKPQSAPSILAKVISLDAIDNTRSPRFLFANNNNNNNNTASYPFPRNVHVDAYSLRQAAPIQTFKYVWQRQNVVKKEIEIQTDEYEQASPRRIRFNSKSASAAVHSPTKSTKWRSRRPSYRPHTVHSLISDRLRKPPPPPLSAKEQAKVHRNDRAFKHWLAKKEKQRIATHDDESSDDSESSDAEENCKAFQKWIENKDQQRKDQKRYEFKAPPDALKAKATGCRNVIILGSTEDGEVIQQDPNEYHRSFQKWKNNKKSENRSTILDDSICNLTSKRCLETLRKYENISRANFQASAISYDEWVNDKEVRQDILNQYSDIKEKEERAKKDKQQKVKRASGVSVDSWLQEVKKRYLEEKRKASREKKELDDAEKERKEFLKRIYGENLKDQQPQSGANEKDRFLGSIVEEPEPRLSCGLATMTGNLDEEECIKRKHREVILLQRTIRRSQNPQIRKQIQSH